MLPLLAGLAAAGSALGGCGLRDSDLIVARPLDRAPPITLEQPAIDAIDERPPGAASLTGGTVGGGSYEMARQSDALYRVSTLKDLKARVGGDTPAVVVVEAGTYHGAGVPRALQVCNQACDSFEPAQQQTLLSSGCAEGAAIFDTTVDADTLRVGSNKTIIGLGAGARLVNVSVVLDGSSNIILRNLAIEQVDSGVVGASNGLSLSPADHVWLDHLTLRDISRGSLSLVSTWDQDNGQALVKEAGYVTLSSLHFDGFVSGSCSQRSEIVLNTNRTPALTVTRTWFAGARIRTPNLFGPGTWAHLFNNLWTDIDGRGLAVSCGAAALAQGNVFRATHNALYNSDSGPPTWQFCAAGYFGVLYAPTEPGVEANLLDANSTMNLGGQPTNGDSLILPTPVNDMDMLLTVPVAGGSDVETYRVTLASDPSVAADEIQREAGVGHLF